MCCKSFLYFLIQKAYKTKIQDGKNADVQQSVYSKAALDSVFVNIWTGLHWKYTASCCLKLSYLPHCRLQSECFKRERFRQHLMEGCLQQDGCLCTPTPQKSKRSKQPSGSLLSNSNSSLPIQLQIYNQLGNQCQSFDYLHY